MLLNNIKPADHLKSIIRFYRIIDFDFSGQPKNIINVKAYRPRIEHCLQFTPFDNETVDYLDRKNIVHKTAIFGQHTELTQRKVGKRFLNFQVVFHPGVLFALFKIPMEELTNLYTDAEVCFGKQIHQINEQLANCKNYDELVTCVEAYLFQLLVKKQPELHPINRIACLLTTNTTQSIDWFANQSNLCYRQFDRAFKANTGIAPKDFRNLVKLDTAYLLKNRNPELDWQSISLQSGFYDYQHLAKNYKKFLGYLPTAFYKLEKQAPERLFGDFEQ